MIEIERYIQSTFNYGIDVDALQIASNLPLRLLDKHFYNVYLTPIRFPQLKKYEQEYFALAKKALNAWSEALFEFEINFNVIDTIYGSDIKVYWTRANRKCCGIQFFEQNINIKKPCITIGLLSSDGEIFSYDKVYHILLHEFGHVLGLGHSASMEDVMSGCCGHVAATELTDNDRLVLNLIYALGSGESLKKNQYFVDNYVNKWQKKEDDLYTERDIMEELFNIGYENLIELFCQNNIVFST